MNDAQLVEACLEGDHRAYTVLVNRYRYPVFGLCLSYVKDFDAAEDAAQEALVAAYLKLESLPEPQKFGPWLRTIAANQCRMWFRRQRRQVAFDEEMAVVDPAPSAAEQVLVRERRQRVLAAVSRLSRLQQQAVVLFYLEGLSLKRIAAFLNVAVPTVEQRLYRARRHLKEEMTTMVKENLQEHRLPEDFTREVVQEALARGRHLLQERQWPEARKAFNRIAAAVPDHLEAHRGLALAFDGETREALRQDAHFSDGHLLDNTFTALHKVCELGSDDPEIARALGRLYSHYGRHEEGGQCLERAADRLDDWRRSVPLYRMAISVYYHAHYTGRGDHMEACVRCHRRARQLVPTDWPPRRRFALWQPSGMSMAYAHLGLSQEVFDELDALKAQSEDEWSVEEHFQYYGICSNQYREMGQWDEVEEHSRAYVDWAKALPAADPRLQIRPLALTEEGDENAGAHNGDDFRWWTVCYALADRILRARHETGRATADILAELDWALDRHQSAGSYSIAGQSACETGHYSEALRYLRHEEELEGRLANRGDIYLAAALVALGRMEEGKERLRNIYGQLVANGQCRSWFGKLSAFDAIRADADMIELVDEWEQAERLGAPTASANQQGG